MRNKNNSINKGFIIGFLLIVIVSVIMCIAAKNFLSDDIESKPSADNPVVSTEITNEETVTEVTTTVTEVPETEATTKETIHEDTVFVYSDTGKELSDLSVVLDKSSNKTYKMNLVDMVSYGESIDSFIFAFSSENGKPLGEVKYGIGISVNENCPDATDEKWFQTEDFSQVVKGSYCEAKWEIPENIKEYIVSAGGKLMFGYWWSDVDSIKLERVTCNKSSFKELPMSGYREKSTANVLNYKDEARNTCKFNISELVPEGYMPQFIAFTISGEKPFGKLTCNFGMTANGELDGYFSDQNRVVYKDTNKTDITWMIPENLKNNFDRNGDIDFSLIWSENQDEIVINKVYVQYSKK